MALRPIGLDLVKVIAHPARPIAFHHVVDDHRPIQPSNGPRGPVAGRNAESSSTTDGPTIEHRRSQQRETLETVMTSQLGDGTHGEAELHEKTHQFRLAA